MRENTKVGMRFDVDARVASRLVAMARRNSRSTAAELRLAVENHLKENTASRRKGGA